LPGTWLVGLVAGKFHETLEVFNLELSDSAHLLGNVGPGQQTRAARSRIQEASMRLYAVGDRVSQPQYGPGTITVTNEYHTVIDFDQHGIRTFVTRMVSLEKSSEPAPVRAKRKRGTPGVRKPGKKGGTAVGPSA